MLLGKVVGTLVATHKDEKLEGPALFFTFLLSIAIAILIFFLSANALDARQRAFAKCPNAD